MVLGVEWLIQLESYATNLEEQFMEFNWQGQHYNYMVSKGPLLRRINYHQQKKLHFTTEASSTRENHILLCFEDKGFLKRVAM
jgi:hypothetical protein